MKKDEGSNQATNISNVKEKKTVYKVSKRKDSGGIQQKDKNEFHMDKEFAEKGDDYNNDGNRAKGGR